MTPHVIINIIIHIMIIIINSRIIRGGSSEFAHEFLQHTPYASEAAVPRAEGVEEEGQPVPVLKTVRKHMEVPGRLLNAVDEDNDQSGQYE